MYYLAKLHGNGKACYVGLKCFSGMFKCCIQPARLFENMTLPICFLTALSVYYLDFILFDEMIIYLIFNEVFPQQLFCTRERSARHLWGWNVVVREGSAEKIYHRSLTSWFSSWQKTYPQATTVPDGPYAQAITHVVGMVTACSWEQITKQMKFLGPYGASWKVENQN